MKFSTSALVAVFAVASSTKTKAQEHGHLRLAKAPSVKDFRLASPVGVKSDTKDNSGSSDPSKILASEQCAPLREDFHSRLTGILEFTDEEIIQFSCNDIQRKRTKTKVHALESDMAMQSDPCVKAIEELVASLDTQGAFDDLIGNSWDGCVNHLEKDLAALRDNRETDDVFVAGAHYLCTVYLDCSPKSFIHHSNMNIPVQHIDG